MKFCLSYNAQNNLAEEIKVLYKDRKLLYKNTIKNKTYIIDLYNTPIEEIKIDELKELAILTKNNLVLCVYSSAQRDLAKEINCPFYYGYPINTWGDLRAVAAEQACYVILDEPLFFELPTVKQIAPGLPIRAVPNTSLASRADGVVGTWIRPEDLDDYEPYISAIEFAASTLEQEQTLYRIYAEKKEWLGETRDLIKSLNFPGHNQLIPPHILGPRRQNCGQECQRLSPCRFCYRVLEAADPAIPAAYRDSLSANWFFGF